MRRRVGPAARPGARLVPAGARAAESRFWRSSRSIDGRSPLAALPFLVVPRRRRRRGRAGSGPAAAAPSCGHGRLPRRRLVLDRPLRGRPVPLPGALAVADRRPRPGGRRVGLRSGAGAGGSVRSDAERRGRPRARPASAASRSGAGPRRGRRRPGRGVGHGVGQPGRLAQRSASSSRPRAGAAGRRCRARDAGRCCSSTRTTPGARRRPGSWPSCGAGGPALRARRARASDFGDAADHRRPPGRRRARGGHRRRREPPAEPATSRPAACSWRPTTRSTPTSARTPMPSPSGPRSSSTRPWPATPVADPMTAAERARLTDYLAAGAPPTSTSTPLPDAT